MTNEPDYFKHEGATKDPTQSAPPRPTNEAINLPPQYRATFAVGVLTLRDSVSGLEADMTVANDQTLTQHDYDKLISQIQDEAARIAKEGTGAAVTPGIQTPEAKAAAQAQAAAEAPKPVEQVTALPDPADNPAAEQGVKENAPPTTLG